MVVSSMRINLVKCCFMTMKLFTVGLFTNRCNRLDVTENKSHNPSQSAHVTFYEPQTDETTERGEKKADGIALFSPKLVELWKLRARVRFRRNAREHERAGERAFRNLNVGLPQTNYKFSRSWMSRRRFSGKSRAPRRACPSLFPLLPPPPPVCFATSFSSPASPVTRIPLVF